MKDKSAIPKMWILYLVGIAILIMGIMLSTPSPTHDPLVEDKEVQEYHGREQVYRQSVSAYGSGIWVEDQSYGSISLTIKSVTASLPSRVIIYSDDAGAPGEEIGRSSLFEGEHIDLSVALNKPLVANEVYYALLEDFNSELVTNPDGVVVLMSFQTIDPQ